MILMHQKTKREDAYIFEDNQWYDIKLRVTDVEFTVWIEMVNQSLIVR